MSNFIISKYIPIIETIREYKKENIRRDIVGALTVTVVGIPQYMALCIDRWR